jgi:hypothetical protein
MLLNICCALSEGLMDSTTEKRASLSVGPGGRLRWAIPVVAFIFIVLRLISPGLAGRVDFVTVALLVVAAIPWASAYISKISIPGVLEAELRELRQQVQQTQEQAQSASKIAIRSQDTVLFSGAKTDSRTLQKNHSAEHLADLGKQYVDLRRRMPGGSARTAAMDELFGKMLKEATYLGNDWKEHKTWLRNEDAGQQLSAIAYAYAAPDAADISALIDTVESSKQPFVQYWGLRAIQRSLDADSPFSLKDVERLLHLQAALPAGTDRVLLAGSINRTIKSKLHK